jgi:hypothetical protein
MPKAEIEEQENAPETEEQKPKRGRGRPLKGSEPAEGSHGILESVANVNKAEWGTRVVLYVYRLEPIIDRSRSGQPNYICQYEEPINEDKLMGDFGSGKYKLILNFRKPGARQGDEIDTGFLKILNMKFPPKVPDGEWVDDPRNKEWAWAKQFFKGNQPGPSPLEAVENALNLSDRIRGPQQQSNPVKDTLDTIKGVKELIGTAPQRDPTQELSTVVTVAEKLAALQRPPDGGGMTEFILKELSASRAENRDLMKMLLESRGQKTDSIGMVKEVVGGLKDLLPEVKGFFPSMGEDGGGGGRSSSRMNGWQEFVVGLTSNLNLGGVLAPFASVAAGALMNRFAGQPAPMPPHPGQPPPAGPLPSNPALPAPAMMPFLQMIANPMLNYIRPLVQGDDPTEAGEAFGSWVFDGFGANPQYAQAILAAKGMGAVGIVAALKQSPFWLDKGPTGMMPSLAELEPKLPAFFTAFLEYDPNADTGDEDEEEEDSQVPPNLKYKEANAG